jgi:hypothetical protein
LAILNVSVHQLLDGIHFTAPFNFGAADWTSFSALQPRFDASPMENVLWRKANNSRFILIL